MDLSVLQTFSDFGTVLRIITYTKYSQFQVLLEYPDAACAQAAKLVRLRLGGCVHGSRLSQLYVSFSPWMGG